MNLTEDTDPTSADDRCDDFMAGLRPHHIFISIVICLTVSFGGAYLLASAVVIVVNKIMEI